MNNKIEGAKALKRYLKKKISITEALVVMFLITGGVSYSVTTAPAMETAKNMEQQTTSNKVMEKFVNPKNEKEYFEYEVSFKDGTNQEKVLKELKAHVIEKQPKYLNRADATEESILTQEMQGYKEVSVEEYLSKNNAKLMAFKKANNTNKILAGGTGLFGAVAAAMAIFNHDSSSDGGSSSANPPVDPPIDPIDPPVDPPAIPSNIVIINGEEVILDGNTATVNNLNVTTSVGAVVIGEEVNIVMTGDTTISSEEDAIAAMAVNGGNITNVGDITLSKSGDLGMLAQSITPNASTFSTSQYTSSIQTTVINEGNIGGISNVAMIADGLGSTAINSSTGTITTSSLGVDTSYGMHSINSGAILNDGKISNTSIDGNSYGMYTDGTGSIAVNKSTGVISNSSDTGSSYGMYAYAGGTATNEGTISNTSNSGFSVGMYANGAGSTSINKGTISNNSDSGYTYGMYSNGGEIVNEGTILSTSKSGETQGMFVVEGTGINKGTISNSSFSTDLSFGITATEDGTATNEGLISNTAESGESYGMNGTDGTVINSGEISNESALNNSYGMLGNMGGTAINKSSGKIHNNSDTANSYGMYANAQGASINKGEIYNRSPYGNSYGMYAAGLGSTATNTSTGVISNTADAGNSYGMYADVGGMAINDGTISNTSNSGISYGMYATGLGSITVNTSTGIINNESTANSYGMYTSGNGAIIVNEGEISNRSETTENSYGMYADAGGAAINEGTIKNNSNSGFSVGMYAKDLGSTALNKGTISNTSTANHSYGIYSNGGTVTNLGVISNTSELSGEIPEMLTAGIFTVGGLATNKGTIKNFSLGTVNSFGITATEDGTAINAGIISNTSEAGHSYGMETYIGGTITNTGKILNTSVTGDSYGMWAAKNGTAVNEGTISNATASGISYGMYVREGSTAVNTSSGIINVETVNSYGMYATGSGSSITNEGTINISADGGTGMYADNGATIDNQGKIYLNANDGTGIHATGAGTTVKNTGEIYIDNVVVGEDELGNVSENGNQAVKIENEATFVNNGLLMVEGELDTTAITEDGGQVVVEGGTIEAETIRGDFYASGALAMGGYNDTYDTYQMFKADNMYANIYSNSAMFDAELTGQDEYGYYGIEMTRKSFYEIIDNSGYAQYLENNYTAENNTEEKEDLYDAYKLIVTESDLNDAVDETFGNTIYPTLMYQTLSAIRDINTDIKDNVFGRNQFAELNGVRYIGFGKYRDSEVSFDDNRLTEYDREMTTVTLGADKAINNNIRLGALLTVGKADYDFDNGDSREDDMYQLNLIGSYEKDDVLATATAYLGKTDGDLDRTVAFTSIYEEMEGDVENSYYGIDLSLEKRYDLTSFNITPRVELNTIHVEQDSVNEKGTYALDVEETDATSVEGGLGFQIDRTFEIGNGYKLTPIFSAMYYREFADPYEDSTATLSSVSSDKIKIESYDAEEDRGVFYGALELEKNGLGATIGVNHSVDSEGDETTPFVGLGYTF